MALPPERISIKRRMHEDPVETLYLEHAPARDKKRRATEFFFKRLRVDEIEDVPPVPRMAENVPKTKQDKQCRARQNDNFGIPHVRTTTPGDEVTDLKVLKATIKVQQNDRKNLIQDEENGARSPDLGQENASSITLQPRILASARRFHLSREHDVLGPLKPYGGVRKVAQRPKAHLATFVEKGLTRTNQHIQATTSAAPIDRIVEFRSSDGSEETKSQVSGNAKDSKYIVTKRTLDQPSVKLSMNTAKSGQSIRTHPDTWDFDSDQLASELAAFAFELDPSDNNDPPKVVLDATGDSIMEDEYIFETYIRLPYGRHIQAELHQNDLTSNIGVLVIAEKDEELWESYAECDDDDLWDEEDADSNAEDNPANDYPEDEVSSDDELGIGAYRHRRNASDDEEYDLERD